MSDHVSKVAVSSHRALGTWRNVVINIWFDETLPEDVRKMSETMCTHAASHPGGVGILQVIESPCQNLAPASHIELSALLKAGRGKVACSGVVFEAAGFRAASVRAIAVGLSRLIRNGFPHLVFADATSACRALGARLDARTPQQFGNELAAAVEMLRSLRPGAARALNGMRMLSLRPRASYHPVAIGTGRGL